MNRKLLVSIIILLASFQAGWCQSKLSFGIHGGLNYNSVSGINGVKQDRNVLWINAGAHIKLHTSAHFGVKAILQYDQYGRAYGSYLLENSTGTGVVQGSVLFKPTYLNLPVLAEYSTGGKIKVNINAGLFAGLLLSNYNITKLHEDPSDATKITIKKATANDRKTANFGLSIGSGVEVPIHRKCYLSIDVRDNYGLVNVYKANNTSGHTNSLSIQAGLVFRM
ncbi:MAG: porin family protein [Ferruginibacter sp.]